MFIIWGDRLMTKGVSYKIYEIYHFDHEVHENMYVYGSDD